MRRLTAALSTCCLLTLAAAAAGKPVDRPTLVSGTVASGSAAGQSGPQGAEYKLPGGGQLQVGPQTSFRLFGASQQLALRRGAKTPTWSVILKSGRLDVSLPPGAHSAVLISAPNKVTSIVLSGRATVIAGSSGVSVVNRSGEVLAGVADRYKELSPRSQRRFTADAADGVISILPAPPELREGRRMWLARGERTDIAGLEWTKVAGAERYEIVLSDSEGKPIERRFSREPRLDSAFEGLQPAAYRVSVRAIDAAGLETDFGPATSLQILGVELPKGAYSDDAGTIYLAKGQRIRLSHVTGLELAHSRPNRFVRAPAALGLYRNEATTVWLRSAGSNESTKLQLAPRQLSASINIGPKLAVWPRDTVTIEITARDGCGKGVPEWLTLVPKVSLGLEPLKLNWERRGGTMKANVPTPRGPGPWVVRVEVVDQFGIPLGYDFLEVIGAPKKSNVERFAAR